MSYRLKWQGSDVLIEFSGEVVFEDIYEADNIMYGDPRFDLMRHHICDFRNVSSFNVSEDEVKVIAILDKASSHWNDCIKVAIVTKDPYIARMVTVYKNKLSGTNWTIRSFEEKSDAIQWCNP
jgi:hypothetical protein